MTRFLLIDDEEIFNFLAEEVIHNVNPDFQCDSFGDATEALKHIRNSIEQNEAIADVIMVDIRMPGMNGFDFLQTLDEYRESQLKNTIVYILSSSLDKRDHERAAQFSMVRGFESKPLNEEMVIEIIKKLPGR
jgi:CheY-like chemotaxis protein